MFSIKTKMTSLRLDSLRFGSNGLKMLGRRYRTFEEFLDDYADLIYLSYRSGIKEPLMRTESVTYTQDTSKPNNFNKKFENQ